MDDARKLLNIKIAHTLVWVIFVSIILYILYAGISGYVTKYTWIGIGLILGEGLVLLLFGWGCPLTVMARKYSDSKKDNFDIFLPNWLARHNKTIFTSIFVIGLVLVLLQTF